MNFINEKEINVVNDITHDPISLAPRLGQEVSNFIMEFLETAVKPLILHINLNDTNPIDYLYTKEAFGEVFKLSIKNTNLDIIFYTLYERQKFNLLKGIIQSINPKYQHMESSEEEFEKGNIFIKICEYNSLLFIGNLADCEKEILYEINQKKEIKTYDILEEFKSKMQAHEITSAIENLKNMRFVYSSGKTSTEILISVTQRMKSYV